MRPSVAYTDIISCWWFHKISRLQPLCQLQSAVLQIDRKGTAYASRLSIQKPLDCEILEKVLWALFSLQTVGARPNGAANWVRAEPLAKTFAAILTMDDLPSVCLVDISVHNLPLAAVIAYKYSRMDGAHLVAW